ncbi:hypothetical protein VTO42DRAFT_2340 [Malbranchea cinnamomea]
MRFLIRMRNESLWKEQAGRRFGLVHRTSTVASHPAPTEPAWGAGAGADLDVERPGCRTAVIGWTQEGVSASACDLIEEATREFLLTSLHQALRRASRVLRLRT